MDKEDVFYIYIHIHTHTHAHTNTHTKEYYSAIEKNEINVICSNMDGPRECHTEWNKSDREGEIPYDMLYMQNLKRNDTNELT